MNEKPVLVMREGQLSGQRWTIDHDELVIGRGSDCHLTLPERQVSRYHAKIVRQDSWYVLYDLQSKNGTHLNGAPVIQAIVLQDSDEIQIALCVKLVFIGTEATLPLSFEPPVRRGNLVLDEQQRLVLIDGRQLSPPLSLAQFRLIKTLYDAQGAVCDRDAIIRAVWPGTEGMGVTEQAIDALVRRTRERLAELDPYNYIMTVRGHGFRLENEPH
ncbi:MAG: FHA domain-containing protein [Chloroflexota bacterium]